MFVGNPPTHLTQKTVAYLSPSCSGEGFTVAAVQYPHAGKPLSGPATLTPVVVKDGNTSQPAPNRRFLDSSPEWDLGGDLLYASPPAGGSTAQL